MRRIAIQLFDELGREPTDEELAKEIGISALRIAQLRRISMRPTSLNTMVGNEADVELATSLPMKLPPCQDAISKVVT